MSVDPFPKAQSLVDLNFKKNTTKELSENGAPLKILHLFAVPQVFKVGLVKVREGFSPPGTAQVGKGETSVQTRRPKCNSSSQCGVTNCQWSDGIASP